VLPVKSVVVVHLQRAAGDAAIGARAAGEVPLPRKSICWPEIMAASDAVPTIDPWRTGAGRWR
jgi:hypothetical protein